MLPSKYPKFKLDTVVYGDDQTDKSYREAQGLFKSYPNLKAIIAPTTVGVVAAAQVVTDGNLIGKVNVTGLALPSELASAIDSRARRRAWRCGTRSTSATRRSISPMTSSRVKEKAKPGSEDLDAGRVGKLTLDDNNEGAMANPFVFDKSNIDQYSKIY